MIRKKDLLDKYRVKNEKRQKSQKEQVLFYFKGHCHGQNSSVNVSLMAFKSVQHHFLTISG